MTRLLYTLGLTLALPLILLRLAWRGRRQPGYRQHIAERFGHYATAAAARDTRPLIWLHAVSVGETRAAAPLLRALARDYPAHRLLITHMTPTGRDTAETLYGGEIECRYLPYDTPWAVARFLRHYRPVLGLLMETEIWPNLIRACGGAGVPLYLVNARLSEKSCARYRRIGGFTRDTLQRLSGIVAQTAGDARRFESLGAPQVSVMGNLKFDVMPEAGAVARGVCWKAALNGRPVLLAASTREGEEALLLDHGLHQIAGALLVLVPRHPQRFDEVAALLAQRGIAHQRRSANTPVRHDTRVLLGDSMGEMAAYYACCDVAFIGGSLLPFGAQNLIEACALGKPVLVGPHTYNFSEATAVAIAAGAALRVADGADLARCAAVLLGDGERLRGMGAAALAFSREHTGATARLMVLLRSSLPAA